MASPSSVLLYLLFIAAITTVNCNSEGDALHVWRQQFNDPNNVLQSWDSTLVNPCTWFHVTCNNDNSVIRLDLGNANLSGNLIPQLGLLSSLQYLELYNNTISGSIPPEIGNLTNLISLNLHHNQLSGSIPASLGNLASLKFMNLNSNKLSGTIPIRVLLLPRFGNLIIMNVSDNVLKGTVKRTKETGFAITTIIKDPKVPHKKK